LIRNNSSLVLIIKYRSIRRYCLFIHHRETNIHYFVIPSTLFPTNYFSGTMIKKAPCPWNFCFTGMDFIFMIGSVFYCSLRRSEKLLKISTNSYVWKTYHKYFSKSLDFVEIIPLLMLRHTEIL